MIVASHENIMFIFKKFHGKSVEGYEVRGRRRLRNVADFSSFATKVYNIISVVSIVFSKYL